ncbi:shikimate kinase [Pontibacter harenae]|uniref:shikimate kinase n=1 Tax=Pontibacter harenae TaxID=2894083 RepID=UPI001E5CEC91|nr:AAA family ATPase [Pontibacter harenae]
MLIFLVGMMGSGKTTMGRQLAEQLSYTFVDLDEYIVQQEGRTVAQIFEQEGADRFRELEREHLMGVVQHYKQAVVATGGGAPCFFDNMEFINQHGKSVFLDVPIGEITRRLYNSDMAVRPLIAGKTEDELKAFIAKVLEQRRPFYLQAHHILSGENNNMPTLFTLFQ